MKEEDLEKDQEKDYNKIKKVIDITIITLYNTTCIW